MRKSISDFFKQKRKRQCAKQATEWETKEGTCAGLEWKRLARDLSLHREDVRR